MKPETQTPTIPNMLRRDQPARFGWWSDKTLVVEKDGLNIKLNAADVGALVNFIIECNAEVQL
jgi:hypothetical protein